MVRSNDRFKDSIRDTLLTLLIKSINAIFSACKLIADVFISYCCYKCFVSLFCCYVATKILKIWQSTKLFVKKCHYFDEKLRYSDKKQ